MPSVNPPTAPHDPGPLFRPSAAERRNRVALSGEVVRSAQAARPAESGEPLVLCEVSCGHAWQLQANLDALDGAGRTPLEVNLVGPFFPPEAYGAAHRFAGPAAAPQPPAPQAPAPPAERLAAPHDEDLAVTLTDVAAWCATRPGSDVTINVHRGARAYRDALAAGDARPAHVLLTAGGRPRPAPAADANLTMGHDAMAGFMLWRSELYAPRCATDLARAREYHMAVPLLDGASVEWLVHPWGDVARQHLAGGSGSPPPSLGRDAITAGLDAMVAAANAREPGQHRVWQQPLFDAGLAHDDISRLLAPQRPTGRSVYAMDRGAGVLGVELCRLREDFAHRAVPLLALPGFDGLCLSAAQRAYLPADRDAAQRAEAALRRAGLVRDAA